MQVRSGAVGTSKPENVCDPEQPLKSYPSVIEVTRSSADTTNAIGAPWDVVPLHSPTLRDAGRLIGRSAVVHALRTQDIVTHHAVNLMCVCRQPQCRRNLSPGAARNGMRDATSRVHEGRSQVHS